MKANIITATCMNSRYRVPKIRVQPVGREGNNWKTIKNGALNNNGGISVVGCNTEVVATPQQPPHKRGQHGGGRPLRKRFLLVYCIFIFISFLIIPPFE